MAIHSNRSIGLYTSAILITEGLALLGLGLALLPSGILGALFLAFAAFAGIVSVLMLLIGVVLGKIDIGTIIAFVPFCGFAIWGIGYSLADTKWAHNLPFFIGLLLVVVVLWLYVIVRFVKHRR